MGIPYSPKTLQLLWLNSYALAKMLKTLVEQSMKIPNFSETVYIFFVRTLKFLLLKHDFNYVKLLRFLLLKKSLVSAFSDTLAFTSKNM